MGGPWRVAKSLDTLLAQINAAYPNRSKVADGAIGDAAHAASVSDHNPDQYGVVRARDYTHDPAHGFDAHAMADRIVASRDPRIKYVISRGRIASSTISPWVWRTYDGSNRHDHHAHVSVVPDARADNTSPWTITPPAPPEKDELMDVKNPLNGEEWPAEKALWSIWTYAYNGARDAAAALAIAKAQAKAAKPLTASEIDDIAAATVAAFGKDYEASIQLTPKES